MKPSARDNNSTDTEYSSNLSDTGKHGRNMKKTLLKDFKDANQKEVKAKQQITIQQISASAKQQQKAKKVIKDKQDMGSSKAHDCLNKEVIQPPPEQNRLSSQSNTLALIERVKSQSGIEVEQQNTIEQTNLEQLDQLLFIYGIKRVRVNAYEDCYFEAAAFSLTAISEKICQHLDENMEQ